MNVEDRAKDWLLDLGRNVWVGIPADIVRDLLSELATLREREQRYREQLHWMYENRYEPDKMLTLIERYRAVNDEALKEE